MSEKARREDIRNIAIIAHVDHGKTTLVDALLKQTGAYEFKEGEDTVMDTSDLERERGITIFSKNASMAYKGVQINIVDTPGHADFGSEVERILKMVDGALLLVDAFEGPKPQTTFVLKKSLALGLRPILVVNKIDRQFVRPEKVVDLTFDLFCSLNASDEQLDFPIIYSSGRDGKSTLKLGEPLTDLSPILDTILSHVPAPIADVDAPFQMQVTMLDYNNYVGSIASGRILNGKVSVGDSIGVSKIDGTLVRAKVTKIMHYKGLTRVETESAKAGDIISLAGVENPHVGETLTDLQNPQPLPPLTIDEPTISMNFSHNTGPLSGKDGGKFLTSRHVLERLRHEVKINVGIGLEVVDGGERFKVSGRGELHLSILIETMRREGFELEISPPQVILKEIDGKTCEPVEKLSIEVPSDYQGAVMQALGSRKAELKEMNPTPNNIVHMDYLIPARALLGFRNEFLTMTRGTGVMYHSFSEYQPFKGELPKRKVGALVAHEPGKAVAYALYGLQDRGEILIHPGDDVYEGMIVGVNNKGSDLTVNVLKGKKLTNMRTQSTDEAIQLTPPREMTLEFAMEFIEQDELVEVTPKNIRLRKRFLTKNERDRHRKKTEDM